MPFSFTIGADDCQHPRYCRSKRVGPHAKECPTNLHLSDGDVLAFFAQYGKVERPNPGVEVVRGTYRAATASSSEDNLVSKRWLAEHLIDFVRRRDA